MIRCGYFTESDLIRVCLYRKNYQPIENIGYIDMGVENKIPCKSPIFPLVIKNVLSLILQAAISMASINIHGFTIADAREIKR